MMDIQTFMNTFEFSNFMWVILTPMIFSAFDVVTGFVQAVINNDVDSSKMRKGLLHKFLLIIIIFLSLVLDVSFGINYITKVVSVYIILMEMTSILENLKKAGINMGEVTKILIDEGSKKNEVKQRRVKTKNK